MKRPKFAVRFSCEHVERGGAPFVELGLMNRGTVRLFRSCDSGACLSRVIVPMLSELPTVEDLQVVAASIDALRVAVAPSSSSGWIARAFVWCLRVIGSARVKP